MFIKKRINVAILLTTVAAITIGAASVTPAVAAIDGDFAEFDYDDDSGLNENEWVDYSYDVIDYNDDDLIGEDEWNDYTSVWYDPFDATYDGAFSDYDADDDGFLSDDEYASAYDKELYDAWDGNNDGIISNNEYDTALDLYDDTGDGGIFDW